MGWVVMLQMDGTAQVLLPALSTPTIIFCQFKPASIEFRTFEFLHGTFHVIVTRILNNTECITESLNQPLPLALPKTHPSPTRCLWASAKVISPADRIKSFKSWEEKRPRKTDKNIHTPQVPSLES